LLTKHAVGVGGAIFDENINLNESTHGMCLFLGKSTKNGCKTKIFEVIVGLRISSASLFKAHTKKQVFSLRSETLLA
jgi:hypothetical protein